MSALWQAHSSFQRKFSTLRSSASSFSCKQLIVSLRSSTSGLRLLPRLSVTPSFFLYFLQTHVLESTSYARCNQSSSPSFISETPVNKPFLQCATVHHIPSPKCIKLSISFDYMKNANEQEFKPLHQPLSTHMVTSLHRFVYFEITIRTWKQTIVRKVRL
jgi:hypothetical protein